MTREQAKELLPIIQAFVDGKTIEARTNSISKWVETTTPKFDLLHEYRIKPEPKYRPFKNVEDCWQEMLKHQPFGWVKIDGQYTNITKIDHKNLLFRTTQGFWYHIHRDGIVKDSVVTFADGTPFGIKVG